ERQHLAGASGLMRARVMPEAEVAYLVQPPGQYVLEEAAHELVAAQTRRGPAARFPMLVADGDAVEPDDSAFGDRHAEDVAGEIAQHRVRERLEEVSLQLVPTGPPTCSEAQLLLSTTPSLTYRFFAVPSEGRP